MKKTNCQKVKLLKIMEILRRETDEDHLLKTGDICKRLVAMGITCDRRTLHIDMKDLNDQGYEIMSELVDHERAYYVADRNFDIPELKILIDAVQAASFITDKKTTELIDKIADLGGGNRADVLKSSLVNFNTRKHTNESVFYVVDRLEDAILKNKKVIFKYFDIDENGERIYRKNGHHYKAEPVTLIFSEDNYYMLSYYSAKKSTTNYRIDRMESVEIIDEDISETAKELRGNVAGYTGSVFKMYKGEPTEITLQFSNELLGPVYDKFGEDTIMQRIGEDTVTATVAAQISPTFWGWIFQFGGKMTISEPAKWKKEYKKQAEALINAI